MAVRERNHNPCILQRFIRLSTAGDNGVDNPGQPSVIPIFSSQAHNKSGFIGIFPWINCVHTCA